MPDFFLAADLTDDQIVSIETDAEVAITVSYRDPDSPPTPDIYKLTEVFPWTGEMASILQLCADGRPTTEIASHLGRTVDEVLYLRQDLFAELNVISDYHAVATGFRLGLLSAGKSSEQAA